ncbi:MAG: K(+)/H(+) antiporter NhaP2 [uncultured Gemmatimonadetes bacterium]|uniref:K(+)/H(+) antiporter NhaP2 n=1 Tax=uncultured Gemmatimonadota bacterium TaxID=203437 RepID=A0A6J4L4F2_9BACT|nr:MAG: K(+)/H(+) antiporter NhaP2 [uncultured Gemmatimonadota bacterium]
MFAVDRLILLAGILLLLGIASSKFSARLGLPVLVLFLAVGMLAGSEGFGGIEFEDYPLAHGIGTAALALILFDGGLRTPLSSIRLAWKPSFVLATVGVLITSVLTGLAAMHILGISLLEGILLGGIVGSTDAAVVFAVLRSSGLRLRDRLSATLEIESGSNDPMAIFLTVGMLQVLLGRMEIGTDLLWLFVLQMGVGALAGVAVGRAGVWAVNRVNLDAAGLYPILVSAFGLLAYGLAASLQGSGFLAVYVAGIVLGNSRLVFQRGVLLFHDAGAWLGQIVMFVVLGLLSFPSRLLDVAPQGLLVALVLILVARPLAVVVALVPFRFDAREIAFLSWVGLKGAVPITLATFPLLLGLPSGPLIFNVVFFVVLISALTQGVSLPFFARRLGLDLPTDAEPALTLEITSLRDVDGDIVEYTVAPESRAAGKRVRGLALPDGVVLALIARGQEFIPPRGSTRVEAGDHLFVVLRSEVRTLVDRVFTRSPRAEGEMPAVVEFPLRGTTTVGELEEFYGIRLQAPDSSTLDVVVRESLGEGARPGSRVVFGEIALSVHRMGEDGEIDQLGLTILPPAEEEAIEE